MAEEGIAELDRARRKAAERTGIGDRRCWPNNQAIQEALLEYRRLFQGERQDAALRRLRTSALEAMRTFARFSPRLVGPALNGTGNGTWGVRLHLFADNPEDVLLALIDQRIPWQEREESSRFGNGVRRSHPTLSFLAGDTPFELVVLPRDALRHPPLDPVSQRPERGANARDLRRLLDESSAPPALAAPDPSALR